MIASGGTSTIGPKLDVDAPLVIRLHQDLIGWDLEPVDWWPRAALVVNDAFVPADDPLMPGPFDPLTGNRDDTSRSLLSQALFIEIHWPSCGVECP